MENLKSPIKVLLVDDHPIVRAGIRAELDKLAGVTVVGEASDGRQAIDLVNTRANLLDADKILSQQLDKYLFIRTAFLQSRQSSIYDGHPPPEKEDYQIYDDSDKPDSTKPEPAPDSKH